MWRRGRRRAGWGGVLRGQVLRKASKAGGGDDPPARVAHGGTLAPQEWGCLSVLGEHSLCDSPPRTDSGTGFGAQCPGPWAKGGPVGGSDRHTVPAAHTTVDRWMQRAHGHGHKCQGSSMHHQCTTVSRRPCAPEAAAPGWDSDPTCLCSSGDCSVTERSSRGIFHARYCVGSCITPVEGTASPGCRGDTEARPG